MDDPRRGRVVTLSERLRDRIAEGPISFRDWMDACLYDPEEGYYTRRRGAARTGTEDGTDFATSPTLHPFMAQCIGREIHAAWDALGRPEDFVVVEYGGGAGDMERDASAWLQAEHSWSPRWHHVEVSPDHQNLQEGAVGAPERFQGVVVAHEFLDALPVHLIERRMGHWAEVVVHGEPPELMTGMPSQAGNDAAPAIDVPDGHRVVANKAAKDWFKDVGRRMTAGRVVVVDYGAEGMALWGRDPEWGTLRTFRAHAHGGSPLDDPGEQDITASIDFVQTRAWAQAAGLEEVSLESQEEFLLRHGALDAINAADRSTQEGASQYLRLRQLLLPTAMGQAFKVQVLEKGMG